MAKVHLGIKLEKKNIKRLLLKSIKTLKSINFHQLFIPASFICRYLRVGIYIYDISTHIVTTTHTRIRKTSSTAG